MSGGSHDIESAGVEDDDDPSSKKKGKPRTGMGVIHRIGQARRRAKVDFDFFVEFMEPHKRTIWSTFVQVTVSRTRKARVLLLQIVSTLLCYPVVYHGSVIGPCCHSLLWV